MFHHKPKQRESTATNPYALAAARAMTPVARSQTPTLSQSAAAAALHTTSPPPMSPAHIVTKRMERKNSQTSNLSRRESDASMSGRLGMFRDNESITNGRRPSKDNDTLSSDGRALVVKKKKKIVKTANTGTDVPPIPTTKETPEYQRFTHSRGQSASSNVSEVPSAIRSTLRNGVTYMVDDAATKPVKRKKKKTVQAGTTPHLTNGTLRTTVTNTNVAATSAPTITEEERQRQRATNPSGVSDEAMALARELMRRQQPQQSSDPVQVKKKTKKKKALVPEALDDDEDLVPPPKIQDPAGGRRNYAGSISSINSFNSDLESITEEQSDVSNSVASQTKNHLSQTRIVPGQGGVPELPNSHLLANIKFDTPMTAEIVSQQHVNSTANPQTTLQHTGSMEVGHMLTTPPKIQNILQSEARKSITTAPFSMPHINTIPATPPLSADGMQMTFPETDTGLKSKKPAISPDSSPSQSPNRLGQNVRHSPPPRSRSPAKSALKHSTLANMFPPDTSDRSSLHSNDDYSARKKSARVSFSEENNVVELDEAQYKYQPVGRTSQDEIVGATKPATTKSIGDISFSSVGRERAIPDTVPEGFSSDSRLSEIVAPPTQEKPKKTMTKKVTTTTPPSVTANKEPISLAQIQARFGGGESNQNATTTKQGNASDSDGNSIYSDAYEDLEHVVLSPTGSGQVLGVQSSPGAASLAPAGDAVILPSISEIVASEARAKSTNVTGGVISSVPVAAGERSVEAAINDPAEQAKKISTTTVKKKKVKAKTNTTPVPVTSALAPVTITIPTSNPKPVLTTAVSSTSQKKTTPMSVPPKSPKRSTAPSPQIQTSNAKPMAQSLRAQSAKNTTSAPSTLRRTASSSSESSVASASSYQRENARSKNPSGGFAMKKTMRGASTQAVPSTRPEARASEPVTPNAPSAREFSSGFRSSAASSGGRPGGLGSVGGSRMRSYSPDSSDDESAIGKRVNKKPSAGSGFFGKGTLRGTSTVVSAPVSSAKKQNTGMSAWKSKYADSSSDDEAVQAPSLGSRLTRIVSDSSESSVEAQPIPAKSVTNKADKRMTSPPVMSRQNSAQIAVNLGREPARSFDGDIARFDVTPRKKWWSVGSTTSSRPGSSAGLSPDTSPRPILGARRDTNPEATISPPRGSSLRKFRRSSSNSISSVKSNATWTPGSTTTGMGSHAIGEDFNRRRMSGLMEMDETDEVAMVNAPANTGEVGVPLQGVQSDQVFTAAGKRKKFPKLRKLFGIRD